MRHRGYHAGAAGRCPRLFADEDLCRNTRRPPARLVRGRCRGTDPGPLGDSDCRCVARQAQARVHAPHRHRRLHRRRQRGEDSGHRRQAEPEALLAPQRLSGGDQVEDARRDARAPPRGGHPQGRQGNAPPQPARPPAADQVEGLRRLRAPACCAAAETDGDPDLIDDENQKDETTPEQDEAGQPADPVAGDDSSSSQAAGEEPTPRPPAGDADESGSEAPEVEAEPVEESVGEKAEEPVAEEVEPAATEAEPAKEKAPEKPKAEEKKKDVIPGADLEPIAVEPEERPLSAEELARKEAEEEERLAREAALVGDAEEEPSAARAPAKIEGDARYLATGKRKTSIARVTVLPGSGKIEVNKRTLEEFFPRPLHQTTVRQPLTTTGYEGNVDVRVRVHGGGISGQAGAVRHGIARALTEVDPELRGELKRRGFLTRDARAKERKKAGLKKARKRPQFS